MKKSMFIATLLLSAANVGLANDATYFANGSQLVPLHETDIAVSREVLTITLTDDGYALVDVEYEFMNHGAAKTVDMGFEAARPYNSGDDIPTANKVHPYIYDFTVTMNGRPLSYRNDIVEFQEIGKPYKGPAEGTPEEFANFSYAYLFQAPFTAGKNSVRHTYRYQVSNGVGRAFIIPYWLTPATRWRGGAIGDFTLRIRANNTAKHFVIIDSLMCNSGQFVVTQGAGKVRHNRHEFFSDMIEVALRNGTVEWHATNFRPTEDIEITSADMFTFFDTSYPVGTFYDRGDNYVPAQYGVKIDRRIARNLPYANRGYVFKDKTLRRYFNQLWWYMPDPSYKPTDEDFTPRELRLINEGN